MTIDAVCLDDPRVLRVFNTENGPPEGYCRRVEGLIERNERVTQLAIYCDGLRRSRVVLFSHDLPAIGPVVAGALAGAKGACGQWKKEKFTLEMRTAQTSVGPVLTLKRIDDGRRRPPWRLYENEIRALAAGFAWMTETQ